MRCSAAATVTVAAALALALSACGGGSGGSRAAGGGPTSSTTAATTLAAAVDGLCAARSQVDADPRSVRATFYDRSHEALHTIARQLETVDRGLAARLLEAKEAVEADVTAEPPAPSLAADLDHLIDEAGQGLARLSVPGPAPRSGGHPGPGACS